MTFFSSGGFSSLEISFFRSVLLFVAKKSINLILIFKTRNQSFGVDVSEVISLIDVCFDGTIILWGVLGILKIGIVVLRKFVFFGNFIPFRDWEIIYFAFEIVVSGIFRIFAQGIVNAVKCVLYFTSNMSAKQILLQTN